MEFRAGVRCRHPSSALKRREVWVSWRPRPAVAGRDQRRAKNWYRHQPSHASHPPGLPRPQALRSLIKPPPVDNRALPRVELDWRQAGAGVEIDEGWVGC
jgi:hypothetical protein